MEPKFVLDSIQKAINKNNLSLIQKGNLNELIEDYSIMLENYKKLTEEEKKVLFENVKKQRPLIGKNLQEQLDKDC